MAESSQEKTEDATPKRLREARKKGQVPKSRDLSTILVLIVFFATLCFSMGYMGRQIKTLMHTSSAIISTPDSTGAMMLDLGTACLITLAKVCVMPLAAGFIIAGIVGFLQVG